MLNSHFQAAKGRENKKTGSEIATGSRKLPFSSTL